MFRNECDGINEFAVDGMIHFNKLLQIFDICVSCFGGLARN
ncbi:hypothetical protein DSM25559_0048 [Agrobacterium rosae]|uniref:Uncharacterized protein n=1 Tax=Agrobacterium rosae TaxID=1972867 RepID=A0A1R3TCU9_9HYPH|nr:hypothetical protein DSM25559_0048 [Agrobacterium rosae]